MNESRVHQLWCHTITTTTTTTATIPRCFLSLSTSSLDVSVRYAGRLSECALRACLQCRAVTCRDMKSPLSSLPSLLCAGTASFLFLFSFYIFSRPIKKRFPPFFPPPSKGRDGRLRVWCSITNGPVESWCTRCPTFSAFFFRFIRPFK